MIFFFKYKDGFLAAFDTCVLLNGEIIFKMIPKFISGTA